MLLVHNVTKNTIFLTTDNMDELCNIIVDSYVLNIVLESKCVATTNTEDILQLDVSNEVPLLLHQISKVQQMVDNPIPN